MKVLPASALSLVGQRMFLFHVNVWRLPCKLGCGTVFVNVLLQVSGSKTDPKDYREHFFWVNQRIGDRELEKKSPKPWLWRV